MPVPNRNNKTTPVKPRRSAPSKRVATHQDDDEASDYTPVNKRPRVTASRGRRAATDDDDEEESDEEEEEEEEEVEEGEEQQHAESEDAGDDADDVSESGDVGADPVLQQALLALHALQAAKVAKQKRPKKTAKESKFAEIERLGLARMDAVNQADHETEKDKAVIAFIDSFLTAPPPAEEIKAMHRGNDDRDDVSSAIRTGFERLLEPRRLVREKLDGLVKKLETRPAKVQRYIGQFDKMLDVDEKAAHEKIKRSLHPQEAVQTARRAMTWTRK